MFNNHKSVQILNHYLKSYIAKVLKVSEGAEGVEISWGEQYAREINSRANAVQNSYEKLNLSIEYLKQEDFSPTNFEFTKHYQYHLESFYLYVFGIIDRCYLLVGVSIMLTDSQIDKLGGTTTINKHLTQNAYASNISDALKTLKNNQEHLRATRNAIAHKNVITNDHIEALDTLSIASDFDSIFTDDFDHTHAEETLQNGLRNKTEKEIDLIVTTLTSDMDNLFQNLGWLYDNIIKLDLMDKTKYYY